MPKLTKKVICKTGNIIELCKMKDKFLVADPPHGINPGDVIRYKLPVDGFDDWLAFWHDDRICAIEFARQADEEWSSGRTAHIGTISPVWKAPGLEIILSGWTCRFIDLQNGMAFTHGHDIAIKTNSHMAVTLGTEANMVEIPDKSMVVEKTFLRSTWA